MLYPIIPSKSWAEWKEILHGFWPGKPQFTEKDYPDLEGKVVLITGGNTGIGYETAKSLAGSTKAKIYILSRNKEKTLEAIKKIQLEVAKEYNVVNRDLEFIQVDLSDLSTIKKAVDEFLAKEKRLDIIIHNAGIMHPPFGSKSKQGYELLLGTNALGHHLLQRLLDPIFVKTSETNKPGESRIVWVSSSANFLAPKGGVFWEDINFENVSDGKIIKANIYGQSKAINIIQAKTWSRKHSAPNVISSSICPGYLRTELQRYSNPIEHFFTYLLTYPSRNGAYTELYAALSPDVKDGQHSISFGVPGIARADLKDENTQNKVWDWLDEQTEPYL